MMIERRSIGLFVAVVVVEACSSPRQCEPPAVRFGKFCAVQCQAVPGALCYEDGGQIPDAFSDSAVGSDARSEDASSLDADDPSVDVRADVLVDVQPDTGVDWLTAVHDATFAARRIATGEYHTCAVRNGAAWCWGHNEAGEIGDGTMIERDAPVPVVGGLTNVGAVAGGNSYSCVIGPGVNLWCWGRNTVGQLADGTMTSRPAPAAEVREEFNAISANADTACGIVTGGVVQCWGGNSDGSVGDGTMTNRSTPVSIAGGITGIVSVATGASHTCALQRSGQLWCWGANEYGQLGDGTLVDHYAPAAVMSGSTHFVAVTAGSYHTCALDESGAAWCWGSNVVSQLGDGSATDSPVPVRVRGGMTNLIAIAAGRGQSYALDRNGRAFAWGDNVAGQLGDGTMMNRTTPVAVAGGLTGLKALASCLGHACVLDASDHVWCWGYNQYGQLGDGTTTSRSMPTLVTGLP